MMLIFAADIFLHSFSITFSIAFRYFHISFSSATLLSMLPRLPPFCAVSPAIFRLSLRHDAITPMPDYAMPLMPRFADFRCC
jgi:hypothetical protein